MTETKDTRSVSVHIRLGDYVQSDATKLYGGICTREYYRSAFSYLRCHILGSVFYIFSNDVEEAKKLVADLADPHEIKFVSTPQLSDIDEFTLLSSCRNQVVANSSYSWWAAWLNANPQKTVVCPSRWINSVSERKLGEWNEVFPPNWIRIDPNGVVFSADSNEL